MEKVEISGDTIRLGQFLKVAGVVENGGEAKARIQAGEALVNGKVETRRGRQLRHLDRVQLDSQVLQVFYTNPEMQ